MSDDPKMFEEFQAFLAWKAAGGAAAPATPAAPPRIPTCGELWVEYARYGKKHIPSFEANNIGHGRKLMAFFAGYRWEEVTEELVDEYRELRAVMPKERGEGSVCARTRNLEVDTLKAMLTWAAKKKKIGFNPILGIEKEPPVDHRDWVLTPDQVSRIIRVCRPPLRLMASISAEVGMRFGECRLLRWQEIHDLDSNEPYIALAASRTKANKARTVPLGPVSTESLRAWPKNPHSEYVIASDFTRTRGRPIPQTTMSMWWNQAREEAGVVGPDGEKADFHGLRHYAAVRAALAGMPWALMKQIFGWESDKVAAKYQHFTRDSVSKAGEVWARRASDERLLSPITAVLQGGRRAPVASVIRPPEFASEAVDE